MYSAKEKLHHFRQLSSPLAAEADLALLHEKNPQSTDFARFDLAPCKNAEDILFSLLDVAEHDDIVRNRREFLAASENPDTDGGSENPNPNTDGGSENPNPDADGGSENPNPDTDGGSENPNPNTDGGSENPNPDADGGSENPNPDTDGGSENPNINESEIPENNLTSIKEEKSEVPNESKGQSAVQAPSGNFKKEEKVAAPKKSASPKKKKKNTPK
ncbi:hypothetical protein HMPREF9135_0465 [Segatella baroniae F0067]|uniref:Uncharacterized protein n=1 Tax=Segatella baroniae F0067 TaxID=1115809 RepID=U2P874_9BACT|nr:hypothetical protein [Segatella baroniae]ERK40356.1 hypothetical protein HMPREF9135_0465 [Segatella baroniae F0067]